MEDGSIRREQVGEERWGWAVVYQDGSEIKQFGDDGVFHQIGEVRQEDAREFILYRMQVPEGEVRPMIRVQVPEGAKLIHSYVRRGFMDGAGKHEILVYRFGFKLGGVEFCNYVMPDDVIVQSTGPISIEL